MRKPKYCTACGKKLEPWSKMAGFSELTGERFYHLYLRCETKDCLWNYQIISTDVTQTTRDAWMAEHSPAPEPEPSLLSKLWKMLVG